MTKLSALSRSALLGGAAALCALALAACGGGGGSPGGSGTTGGTGGGTTPAGPGITLAIIDSSGQAVTTLSGSQSATLRAVLTGADGKPLPQAVVTFRVAQASIAVVNPDSALTDANGVATSKVMPASTSAAGATSITVESVVKGASVTATVNLSVVSGGSSAAPVITLAMTDGAGKPVTSLSGAQSAGLRAVLTGSDGKAIPQAVVNFKVADSSLATVTPDSALTDDNGVAVSTVTPANVTAAGATTITVQSVVKGSAVDASVNLGVGAAPLTIGALALDPNPSGPLAAFSTVTINIPVTSGGVPATKVSGLVLTSLCQGDGTATLVEGTLNAGIQTATYTNNGCLRGTDTITVTIGASSQTISVPVSPAVIGAISFIGTNLSGSSIVLKGSGGLGREEAAQLTFRVVDQHNSGLPGVDVTFAATTTTGGLTVSPTRATSDANGDVRTIVTSGTIPTPVRVVAQASRLGTTISGLSDFLTVSTGLPIQRNMSLSSESYNVEGWSFDGQTAKVTVYMADQYGNPVADGTTVNFISEGGAIASAKQGACTTVGGNCTVLFNSQEFRPTNGRVTVLAYAQGIEDFVDTNGDGQYTCTDPIDANGAKVEQAAYRPLVDICRSGGETFVDLGDAFLDAGKLGPTSGPMDGNWLDGHYDPANGDLPVPYGHPVYTNAGDGHWGINYIRRSIEITLSDGAVNMVRQVCDSSGNNCRDWTSADGDPTLIKDVAGPGCSAQPVAFRLYDRNNNPLPKDTVVSASDAVNISSGTFFPTKVPSTNAIGGTIHRVLVKPDATCKSGNLYVIATTPLGLATAFPFHSN